MPFPEYPRYRYEKHTLQNVICQLRFPTILRIGTEQPSDFQDSIRDRLPSIRKSARRSRRLNFRNRSLASFASR